MVLSLNDISLLYRGVFSVAALSGEYQQTAHTGGRRGREHLPNRRNRRRVHPRLVEAKPWRPLRWRGVRFVGGRLKPFRHGGQNMKTLPVGGLAFTSLLISGGMLTPEQGAYYPGAG